MDRGEQAQLLRWLVTLPGMHRAFNRWIQERHAAAHPRRPGERPARTRPLLGLHDVLPFLDAHRPCRRCGGYHAGGSFWGARATEELLTAFKRRPGASAEALLEALRGGRR
jgi:hypothetical protein